MVRCSEECVPTCQHCIYAEYEKLELNSRIYNGEAERCSKHNKEVNALYWCEDFHCCRSDEEHVWHGEYIHTYEKVENGICRMK